MKVVSQIAEDLFHMDLRVERLKQNTQWAAGIAIDLAKLMLADAHGVSRDVYEKLLYLLDVLPVTDSAKAELRQRIDCTDGRWHLERSEQ